MRTSIIMQKLFFIAILTALMAFYQNCSKVGFDENGNQEVSSQSIDSDSLIVVSSAVADPADPVDPGTEPGGTLPSPTPSENPPVAENPPPTENPPGDAPTTPGDKKKYRCGRIPIEDVIVNVRVVSFNGGQMELQGSGALSLASLKTDGLEFMATGEADVRQVRLILETTGNYAVTANQEELALKTPSQQQSGLKFLVKGDTGLEAYKKYKLQADVDFARQIVHAGKKCLLKPVVHDATLMNVDSAQ